MKLSVLIPYIPDSQMRQAVYQHVVKRWGHYFPDYEIITAGDDSRGLDYNKARAINNAAAKATGDIFVIADADIVWQPETIARAVEMVSTGEAAWMIPFTDCHRLDEKTTQRILEGKPEDDIPQDYGSLGNTSHGPGAVNVLPKEAFEKIGGYDENFVGWGFEDNAFALMLDTFHGKHTRLPDTIYHLMHPRATSALPTSPFRQANKHRYDVYRKLAETDRDALMTFKNTSQIGEPIDCLIFRGRHYIDHMAPIWNALPVEMRGKFYTDERLIEHCAKRGITEAEPILKQHILKELMTRKGLVLLAGHADSEWTDRAGRKSVIIMHGVGFNFDKDKTLPNYPGTTANRKHVILMLSTNETIAAIEREANPHIRVEVVGCPKLDRWHTQPKRKMPRKPVVALAWHWRCRIAPEAGTAWDYYKPILPALAEHFTLIGHGHPNIIDELIPQYEAMGIEVVKDLDEVFERADILVADATSAMYEFATLDRPVVVCNTPEYRRDVDFGLRFWKHSDVGVNCDRPEDLIDAVRLAAKDTKEQKKLRREAVKYAYTYNDGLCTKRAVTAILDAAAKFGTATQPVNVKPLSYRERLFGVESKAPTYRERLFGKR